MVGLGLIAAVVGYAAYVQAKPAPDPWASTDPISPFYDPIIQWIQRTLNKLGYGPVIEDGLWRKESSDAIMRWRYDHGYPANAKGEGSIDDDVLDDLDAAAPGTRPTSGGAPGYTGGGRRPAVATPVL